MVDTLLKHGAQPNDKYGSSTVWGSLLRFLPISSLLHEDVVLRIVESLLYHGGNLQLRIVTGQRTRTREMSEEGACSQKHQKFQYDIVKSAQ